jgi:ferritin-like metal-binding protein YciE/predicted ester cyclase
MANEHPFLATWLRNAYSMEMGLVPMLEHQSRTLRSDPELQKGIDHHLRQTRRHAELLQSCLVRFGEDLSAVRPADPVVSMHQHLDGDGESGKFHAELVDFVTESFEVASYRAIAALAKQAGDLETVRVCQEILQDEAAMANALDADLLGPESSTAVEPAISIEQDNTRILIDNFEHLNRRDLDKWFDDYAADCRFDQVPGVAGTLNREQFRAYIRNFLNAFPDLQFDVMYTIAQGDHAVLNWRGSGRHTGPLADPTGKVVQPTHRQATVMGSTTAQITNGKIGRSWIFWDMASLLGQLGLAPSA